jgi:hypothetical protein
MSSTPHSEDGDNIPELAQITKLLIAKLYAIRSSRLLPPSPQPVPLHLSTRHSAPSQMENLHKQEPLRENQQQIWHFVTFALECDGACVEVLR